MSFDAIQRGLVELWDDTRNRWLLGASGAMVLVAGVIGAWVVFRPVPKPDYQFGRIDTLFNFTLLTDEFNKLPLDERIEMIGRLVGRVKAMDGSDSVLLAAFAARIAGPARDQLVENASRVMVDLTDRAAKRYNTSMNKQDRIAFVEQTTVEMMIAMEAMTGEVRDMTPEERLGEAKEQARRDMEEIDSGRFGAEQAGRVTGFLARTIGANTSAKQRARMGVFARDMARVLRGQDIETGKRLP